MRPLIPFLDTNEVSPANPAPGIYSKILSRDSETGARTALQRLVPEDGLVNQPAAHYHSTYEEILVIDGMMSFDSRTWLHSAAYCFHPSQTVHGFRSTVPVETVFLSRVGQDLDFNYVEAPSDDFPYSVADVPDARELALVPCPFGQHWHELTDDEGIRYGLRLMLSRDPQSGEGSELRRYVAGSGEPAGQAHELTHCLELYVLEGRLVADDGREFGPDCYACLLPGVLRPRFRCLEDALFFVSVGPDARAAAG
jgi:hypothetical protein